jgi:hypothetical protein
MMTTGSTYAAGRPLACYFVQHGDTAAGLAVRLTGDARSRHQPWFQILDPARAAFIPKAGYDSIRSGWHVCVAAEMLRDRSAQPRFAPAVLPQTGVTRGQTAIDVRILWWVAPPSAIVSGLVLGWFVAGKYVGERRSRLESMRGFGARFIREFERPLFRRCAAESAVRSRLRCAPSRQRLEILLAPADGRSYPNLFDHRRNVEYDVERVLQLLGEAPVIDGALHAEGPWVVVPFRFETSRQQEGVA